MPGPGADDSEAPDGSRADATVNDASGADATVDDASSDDSTMADRADEAAAADGGDADAGPDGRSSTNADAGPDGDAGSGDVEAGPAFSVPDGGSQGVIAALRGQTCAQCAVDNQCLDVVDGILICESMTGVSDAGPDPGVPRTALCYATLTCVLQTNCFQNASDIACYCGSVARDSCSTANANGPCKTQEESGFETTNVTEILGTPGVYGTASDVANAIVDCLYSSCNTECSFADAGP